MSNIEREMRVVSFTESVDQQGTRHYGMTLAEDPEPDDPNAKGPCLPMSHSYLSLKISKGEHNIFPVGYMTTVTIS